MILELLQLMRAQMGNVYYDFRPDGDVTQYVPTKEELMASPNLDATFHAYLAELQVSYRRLDASGLLGMVLRASALDATVKATHPVAPLHGIDKGAPKQFDDRLILNSPNGASSATITGFGLVAGDIDPATITSTDAKVEALVQMRRVDDIFIRVQAAQQAAAMINRPVAEVMALYREEGNLGVPPSTASLARMIPSDAPAERTSMPFYHDIWPHLVWLAKSDIVYNGLPMHYISSGSHFKDLAIVDWFLQICGLDELQMFYIRRGPTSMQDMFTVYSQQNWTDAGIPSTSRLRHSVGKTWSTTWI
jgi:hypothetical protein